MAQSEEVLVDGLIVAKCNSHGRDTKHDRRMCYQCYMKWQKVQEWVTNPRKANCQQFESDWLNGKFFFLYPPYIVKKLVQRKVFSVIPYADRTDAKETIKALKLPKFSFPITPEANNPSKYGYGKLLDFGSKELEEEGEEEVEDMHPEEDEEVESERKAQQEIESSAPSTSQKKKKRRTHLSVRKRQRSSSSRSRSSKSARRESSEVHSGSNMVDGDSYSEDEDDEEEEVAHARQQQQSDLFVDNLNRSYQALVHLTEDTKAYMTNQCKVMQEHLAPMQKCIQTLATLKYENEAMKQQLQEREKEMQETEIIRSLMKQLELMQGQLQKRFQTMHTPVSGEEDGCSMQEDDNMEKDIQLVPEKEAVVPMESNIADIVLPESEPVEPKEADSLFEEMPKEQIDSQITEVRMSLEEVIAQTDLNVASGLDWGFSM